MPALQKDPKHTAVLGRIKDVLKQRIGSDRFALWFGDRVDFSWAGDTLELRVAGEFALERLRSNYLRVIETSAAEAAGQLVPIRLLLATPPTSVVRSADSAGSAASATSGDDAVIQPSDEPRETEQPPVLEPQMPRSRAAGKRRTPTHPQSSSPRSIRVTDPSRCDSRDASADGALGADRAAGEAGPGGNAAAERSARLLGAIPMTFRTFVRGTSNTLAWTAAELVATEPQGAAPLCFWGPTGTGKTHLLAAIRHELRCRHRLGRVIQLSAEEFTNDFLACVRGTGLPTFRKRYRDVDALLIDNVQFFSGKNATLRELLYTVDTILSRRRPLVLVADRQPTEIEGLSNDLTGRMSSGLVCGINPLETQLRAELLRRHAARSYLPWDEPTIDWLAERVPGDGRIIQGVAQLVSMLQRMYRRMPTRDELLTHGGDMLRPTTRPVALADVERAVCAAFGVSTEDLRSESRSRNVSDPRILAMYLSRKYTSAAYSEIGRYYGDRNHSTVISANRRVKSWLAGERAIGGNGGRAMRVNEAIAAVENLLRIG